MYRLSGESALIKLVCLPSEKGVYSKRNTFAPLKGVYSKRKEFAPGGNKVFPLRVEPFFRRGLMYRKANKKSKCIHPPQKTNSTPNPLSFVPNAVRNLLDAYAF